VEKSGDIGEIACGFSFAIEQQWKREEKDEKTMNKSADHDRRALGAYVRNRRVKAGMSLRELAAQAQVDPSWLSRLERGVFASPDARLLWRLARALDVEVAELYLAAGYSDGLPGFAPYLRAKYHHLPEEAIAQLEAHFQLIDEKYRHDHEERESL
jgi:transcriptional regulator with XRE-family HTH domain